MLLDNSDSDIAVSHDQISAGGTGVFCVQGYVAYDSDLPRQLPPFPAPRSVLADNGITTPYYGMLLMNYCAYYGAAPRLDASVVGNDISLSGTPGGGTVGIGEFATHDILCAGNTISGTADWGVYLGDDADVNGVDQPVSGWQIVGNDFSGLSASVAPILLGAGTTHNRVCPTPAGTIDNGVENWLRDPSATSGTAASAAAAVPLAAPSTLGSRPDLPVRGG